MKAIKIKSSADITTIQEIQSIQPPPKIMYLELWIRHGVEHKRFSLACDFDVFPGVISKFMKDDNPLVDEQPRELDFALVWLFDTFEEAGWQKTKRDSFFNHHKAMLAKVLHGDYEYLATGLQ